MEDREYRRAQRIVKEKKEFFRHLSVYVVMGLFFFAINAMTSFGSWWFYWPLLGWGLGVLFHYLDVFGLPGVGAVSKDWEEREIQREMRKMGKRPASPPQYLQERNTADELEDEDLMDLKDLDKHKKWDERDFV